MLVQPDSEDGSKSVPIDFFESSPYAQIAFDFDLVILAVNARHRAMTGFSREMQVGRRLFDVYPVNPDDPSANAEAPLRDSVARVRASGKPDTMAPVKHDIPSADDPDRYEARWWQLVHSPLTDAQGAVRGVLQTTRDVSEQETLREVEAARRRSAESAGKIQFWGVELETGKLLLSAGVDRLFSFTAADTRSFDALLERIHPADREAVAADIEDAASVPLGTSFDIDYRVLRPDGSLRYVNSLAEVVMADGRRQLAGVLIDTTVVHRREDSLRRMVEEKQALLADVNHRVKNSLQLVSSLLHLEERSARDAATSARLRAAGGRVSAIAAVHASLYHYADMSQVNVSEHLRTFCGELAKQHPERLKLRIEDEPLYLPAEKAVPLALIVNELISGALHGYEGEGKGEGEDGHHPVIVSLEYHGLRLLLRVENAAKDGVTKTGPHPEPHVPGRPGSRLFDALLEQLGGRYTQDPSYGRSASIEFGRA